MLCSDKIKHDVLSTLAFAGKTPAPAPTNVIGCYKDTGNRDLRHREPNSNAMTNQLCAKACAAKVTMMLLRYARYHDCMNEFFTHGFHCGCPY